MPIDQRGIQFKDLKSFMTRQADRLKAHAEGMAKQAGRPFRYLSGPARKEALLTFLWVTARRRSAA